MLSPPPRQPPEVDVKRRRRGGSDDAERERLAKRAEDARACRARRNRGEACYKLTIGRSIFDLLSLFAGLESGAVDPKLVNPALGKFFGLAVEAFLRERARGRR
jgi:hypothetical protein